MLDFNVANKPAAEPEVVENEIARRDPLDPKPFVHDLKAYQSQVTDIKKRALDHKVTDDASNITAVEMGNQAKRLQKKINNKKLSITKPYRDLVAKINATVKPFDDDLKGIETNLKSKISHYQREQAELARRIAEKKAREEAEARRKELEAERAAERKRQEKERQEAQQRQRELEEKAKAENVEPVKVEIPDVDPELSKPVEVTPEIINVPTGPTRTAEGTGSVAKRWKHRVVDADQVPREYLMVDEKKIAAAVKDGIRSIAGVEIYEDQEVRFRTK